MKKTIFIGLVGGIVLSVIGYLSLIGALFAVECGEELNPFFIGLGNVLLLPVITLDYLMPQCGNSDFVAAKIALMITAQLIWYIGIAFIISKIVRRKKSEPIK